MSGGRILVVDDERNLRLTFAELLTGAGFEVGTADSYESACVWLDDQAVDMVIADILIGDRSGIDLLHHIKDRYPQVPVVMVTGYPNLDSASDAVRLGAFDYLAKPVTKNDLLRAVKAALAQKELHDRLIGYQTNLEAIFRSIRDAIITLDSEGKISAVNEAAQRLCQLSPSVVGRPFAEAVDESSGDLARWLGETLASRRPVDIERHECRFGSAAKLVVSVNVLPLQHTTGKFLGAMLIIRDETRLDHLERNFRERRQLRGMIGKSSKMQEVYGLIEDLANVPSSVLVLGESGTGKELVADAIHFLGERRDKPLVKVNCAAMSETLLESELFGHTRGAFTGAVRDRIGRFQKADGGTIFLDEIGDISHQMQLRLLRVLQEKEIERLGDSRPIPINVRVVAATHQNLMEKVRRGEFREDLFYRLRVVTVELPPLRERREDIPLLVEHFTRLLNADLRKEIKGVSREVLDLFLAYPWPGNIRELRHLLENTFIRCRETVVTMDHLPADFGVVALAALAGNAGGGQVERERLLSALTATGWNKAKAARRLGLDRKTVYRQMKRFGLDGPAVEAEEEPHLYLRQPKPPHSN